MSVISGERGIFERVGIDVAHFMVEVFHCILQTCFKGSLSVQQRKRVWRCCLCVSRDTPASWTHTVESFSETSQSFKGLIWSPAPGLTGARREPREDWHVGQFWKRRKVRWRNLTLFHLATIIQHLRILSYCYIFALNDASKLTSKNTTAHP